jgi:hypothetical protein
MKTNEELEKEIEQLKHELCELRLKLLQQPAFLPMPYPVWPTIPAPSYPYNPWYPTPPYTVTCFAGMPKTDHG